MHHFEKLAKNRLSLSPSMDRMHCSSEKAWIVTAVGYRMSWLTCRIALWKRPLLSGRVKWYTILDAPADTPNTVILLGSPPKLLMCSRTHFSANCWSLMPMLPMKEWYSLTFVSTVIQQTPWTNSGMLCTPHDKKRRGCSVLSHKILSS